MTDHPRRCVGRFSALAAMWFGCGYVPLALLWWVLDATAARWAEWHLWLVACLGLAIGIVAGIVHRSWLLPVVLILCGAALYAAIAWVVFVDVMSGGGQY